MRFPLLRCLAKAVIKHGVKFFCDLAPGGVAVYDFLADVWEDYHRDAREGAIRTELEALAQASVDRVHQEVEADVQDLAADQPSEIQQALTTYLTQVPAAIRRSLSRPSDPTGTTIPATLIMSRPDDLIPFLPPRPPHFRPGDRPLPGVDWELEELVGVGGFGEVWKARHVHLRSKAPVALKFCLDRAAQSVLRNEAGVLDRVMQHGRHPGIVPLLNTYLSAETPCLEYEFVEGGDLRGLIQDLHGQGRMTPDRANRLFGRLVKIVAHAHRADPPIVHGDLKPANVLVSRGSDGKIDLRVTDFGIGGIAAAQAARETRQPTRSRQELLTEAVRGVYTPLYASPEQMLRRRGEAADPRDDVHALGVIWYQLLTGDLVMLSVPSDWREQVEERGLSADLVKLMAACIASKAAKRPTSAVVLAEQLQAILAPAKAPQPKAFPSPAKKLLAGSVLSPAAEHRPGERVAVSLGNNIDLPDPMANEWHYTVNGHPAAFPISAAQLKQMAASGQLKPTDLVWRDGMLEWAPVGSVKGLFPTSKERAAPAREVVPKKDLNQPLTGWEIVISCPFWLFSLLAYAALYCFLPPAHPWRNRYPTLVSWVNYGPRWLWKVDYVVTFVFSVAAGSVLSRIGVIISVGIAVVVGLALSLYPIFVSPSGERKRIILKQLFAFVLGALVGALLFLLYRVFG